MTATTLDAWLRGAALRITQSQSPRLDARVLAKWALKLDDDALIAGADRALRAEELARLDFALERRVTGEPIAYITGEKEFWGLTILCRPPMLLPRPDSETLIAAAIKRRDRTAPLKILDLGTGTGCLLAAALHEFKQAQGLGVDYLDEAVALAATNLRTLGLASRAQIKQGSWTEGLEGPFDLILANPPYVPENERETLCVDIRDFEDPRALFAGEDGLSAYQAIFKGAPRLLAADGLMIVELGAGQADAVAGIARGAFGNARIDCDLDLGGRSRALIVDAGEKTV